MYRKHKKKNKSKKNFYNPKDTKKIKERIFEELSNRYNKILFL